MLHTTNLVRVCRDSSLSGADIQGLVGALAARRRSAARPVRPVPVAHRAGTVTSIVELARTLLATLR